MWADRGPAPPASARARGRGRRADLPADRDRRIAARRAPRGRSAPAHQPDRRDLRPGRGGRRPDLRRAATAAASAESTGRGGRAGGAGGRSASSSGRTGETTWSRPSASAWTSSAGRLAIVEIGSAGSSRRSSGTSPWLRFSEAIAPDTPGALAHGGPDPGEPANGDDTAPDGLEPLRPPGHGAGRCGGRPGAAGHTTPGGHGGLGDRRDAGRRPSPAPAGLPRRGWRSKPGGAGGGGDPPRDAARSGGLISGATPGPGPRGR